MSCTLCSNSNKLITVETMAFPYWKARGAVGTLNNLYLMGDLAKLLPACSPKVNVIITADDPLNDRGDVDAFMRQIRGDEVTRLPRGGHVGYLGTQWWQAVVTEFAK